jgi:hypothetical protein
MAPGPYWKGYLKLSLVICPVAMAPALSDTAKIRFHVLNRATGNRVEARSVDAVTRPGTFTGHTAPDRDLEPAFRHTTRRCTAAAMPICPPAPGASRSVGYP